MAGYRHMGAGPLEVWRRRERGRCPAKGREVINDVPAFILGLLIGALMLVIGTIVWQQAGWGAGAATGAMAGILALLILQ